ncbi:MAG: putative drug exporter of the superfamily, partial [Solirubrobacteraceae bacterium]|nr:putative drug exporter of the superfamily [Solirubrobacteraceae bacterium]
MGATNRLWYKAFMERTTRWVLAHRKLVAGVWILLTVVGIMTAGAASKAMDQRFTVPGREGWETNQTIARLFGGTGADTLPQLAVATLPAGKTAAGARGDFNTVEAALTKANPGSRVTGFGSTGAKAFVSDDGQTAFAISYPPPDPDQPFGDNPDAAKRSQKALNGVTIAGAPVHLTGYDALVSAGGDTDGPGVLIEALVGGFGALIVLAFVFGS